MPHLNLLKVCAETLRRSATVSMTLLMLAVAASSARAASDETIDETFPASVTPSGEYANQDNGENPSISSDGRYVAFVSAADNLGEHGPAGVYEAYVKDLLTGEVELVSRANGEHGEPANEPGEGSGVENVVISGDGRYVIFTSAASNLITGLPTPGEPTEHPVHVYRRDLQTGETVLVDRVNGLEGAILDERGPKAEAISEDGRYVLFRDGVEDLEDPAGTYEAGLKTVYVRDVQSGTTTAVSRASGPNGELASEASRGNSISPEGRYVAFESSATNLTVGMQANTASQIYVRDLQADTTTLLSETPAGEPGNESSGEPILLGDDRCEVAFQSEASNLYLYEGSPLSSPQVYLTDACSTPASTTLLSRAGGEGGAPVDGGGEAPLLLGSSADGRHVLFQATLDALGTGSAASRHLYVRDLETGHTTLVDRASGAEGAFANANPEGAAISANGCRVAFATEANNLGEPNTVHRETLVRQLTSCQPPAEEQRQTEISEEGNGGKQPGTGTGGPQSGGGQSTTTGVTTATQTGGERVAASATTVEIAGLSRTRLLLRLTGPGLAKVLIARQVGQGRHRHWQTIKTITVTAVGAGQIEVRLPHLAAGRYRLTVALAGGRRLTRRLTLARKPRTMNVRLRG